MPRFEGDPEFSIISAEETASINFVEFNYKRPPFDDPAFRRAFGMAIDKEAIQAGAYGGYGIAELQPLSQRQPWL